MFLACSGFAFAQEQPYEIGANAGYGFYRNGSIYSAAGTAQAEIRNRFAAGVVVGDDFSKYVSAEFRYLYHDGHPFLQAPGAKVDMQGNSNALTLGLLFHFKDRQHRMRPYVMGNVGAKGAGAVSAADSSDCEPEGQRRMEGCVRAGRRREVQASETRAGERRISGLHHDVSADADRSGSA